jgi:hypothetical protein
MAEDKEEDKRKAAYGKEEQAKREAINESINEKMKNNYENKRERNVRKQEML